MIQYVFKDEHDSYFRGYVAGLYNIGMTEGISLFDPKDLVDYDKGWEDGMGDFIDNYSKRVVRPGEQFPEKGWNTLVAQYVFDGDIITKIRYDESGHTSASNWVLDPLAVVKAAKRIQGDPVNEDNRVQRRNHQWLNSFEPQVVVDITGEE